MRVTLKTEHACVAMLELAANHGSATPLRSQAIAEAQGIDPQFLVQILLQLKTAGLVASVRGAAGGYRLARPPEAITLAQIVSAVADTRVAPQSAAETRTPAAEVLSSVWQEIQAQEQKLLEQLTLAELLRRAQSSNALVYQI